MRLLSVVLCLMTLAASAGHADTAQARFGVYMLGIKIGDLRLVGDIQPTAYAARARFATSGIVAAVADVRFDFAATGATHGSELSPLSYTENMHTGRESRASSLTFPTSSHRLDPATALLMSLRDRPREKGCAQDFEIFDGKRTMRLTVTETGRANGILTCAGTLHRIAGYTNAEMAESQGFALKVTLRETGGNLTVQTMRAGTIHGTVTVKRR